MISIKKEVRQALSEVCGALVYGYPRRLEQSPLIAWRESLNRRHAQAAGREHLAELNYTLEIFASGSAEADGLLCLADEKLTAMGLRRENAAEQFEREAALCHITARYRALADEEGNIYQ